MLSIKEEKKDVKRGLLILNEKIELEEKYKNELFNKLVVSKKLINDYFDEVEKKLIYVNDNWKELGVQKTNYFEETNVYEEEQRRKLLKIMCGDDEELENCCMKYRNGYGWNAKHYYASAIDTWHFLFTEKLSTTWLNRINSGAKYHDYDGKSKNIPLFGKSNNSHLMRFYIDAEKDLREEMDRVLPFILFGMMVDIMNKNSFHIHHLFCPYEMLMWNSNKEKNKLEYSSKNPVNDKEIGAILWKPFGKKHKNNNLVIDELKKLMEVYNLISFP